MSLTVGHIVDEIENPHMGSEKVERLIELCHLIRKLLRRSSFQRNFYDRRSPRSKLAQDGILAELGTRVERPRQP